MGDVPITIVTDDYDRIQPVRSGRVPVEGCEVTYLTLKPGETFFRLFTYREFDVAEMSFSTYLLARARGDWPYRALPIFVSRVFAHGSIYVRTDRGIETPADLKGRTLGLPSYPFTRGLCARGLLRDEYGVEPADIAWRVGGVDQPEDFDFVRFDPPPGVDVRRIEPGQCLGDLLAAGRIDGLVSYRDPRVLHDGTPNVGRLFPDFRAAERAYFAKTGIFPIMHLLGIRETLVERYPWIARSLVKAFEEAKALVLPRLADLDALAVTLPWLVAETRETIRLMGEDYWPYGIEKNRATLEAQTRWSFEQGLSPRRVAPEELFVPSTLRWFR
jgi:4,5-dihydroxyphthalate decarboxylase